MSGWEEPEPCIGQHDDFWRSDNESRRYDPKNTVTTRRPAELIARKLDSGGSAESPVERRLLFAA
jgi:hypothetical protein